MSKSKKSRGQLLGEAVCGFVNAETIKEANRTILAGIQEVENFNSSFIEEVRKVFPGGKDIISYDVPLGEQKDEISSLENKVLSSLRKEWGGDIEYVRCNQQEQSFEFGSERLSKSYPTPAERVLLWELGWYMEALSFSPLEDEPLDYSDLENIYKVAQDLTIKVFALDTSFLETLEDESLKNDIISLNKLWTSYNTIIFSKSIRWHQKKMRDCLSWLIYPSGLQKKHTLLSEYLEIYNEMAKHVFEIDKGGNLRKRYQFREEDYLNIKLPLKWLDRIKSDLAYSLIEFLKNENRRKLKKCPYCSHFFIAERINRVKCYSDECEKTYQARKKKKQRDKDPVKYL